MAKGARRAEGFQAGRYCYDDGSDPEEINDAWEGYNFSGKITEQVRVKGTQCTSRGNGFQNKDTYENGREAKFMAVGGLMAWYWKHMYFSSPVIRQIWSVCFELFWGLESWAEPRWRGYGYGYDECKKMIIVTDLGIAAK